jgi:hypothetical protein
LGKNTVVRSADVASWADTTACEECISCPECEGCNGACKMNSPGARFLEPGLTGHAILEGLDWLRCPAPISIRNNRTTTTKVPAITGAGSKRPTTDPEFGRAGGLAGAS